MKIPTATIYQNETEVITVFSSVKDFDGTETYRGASANFENNWSDGGACGLGGFDSRKELNEYIKKHNFVKKGSVKLSLYCWSQHTIEKGATITCESKPNHKGKHSAMWGATFGIDKSKEKKYSW